MGSRSWRGLKRIVMTGHETILGYEQFVGLKDSTLYCNYCWGTPSLGLPSQTLLLRNVEELIYAPARCWDPGNLTTLLGQLPSLRRLKVSGALWDRFDEAVGPLQELSVRKAGFKNASQLDELHIYPLDNEKDLQPEEGTDPVVMLGNIRANNGYPLKKIVVQHFHEESIRVLQGYFDDVVVLDEEVKTDISKDDVFGSCWRSYKHSI
ncbi:hypothetical protein P691DRAFT_421841 [Macrolepiota fuliginosa MF-IS2]|uniref:Uncharacterized protein n=1 Tax=Macrolepiota fuliginosa MF-IS2 TaxID=1400762 RepID=A0A9P6BZ78_9AGAR|nr:hypothetical protein P691DRAFT_421841 [Macrolepiota fuliginosa MF-IS2]